MLGIFVAALAFTYYVQVDEFTDERTYAAEIGDSSKRSLSVECGPFSNNEMMVRIVPGKDLYQRPFSQAVKYTDRVRFGTQPPGEVRLTYHEEQAFVTGQDALAFIAQMESADTLLLEMTDYGSEEFTIRFPLTGAKAAIARVREKCGR